MTEYTVQYRGVDVPAEVLTGLMGAATLAAFKKGVDAVKDQPSELDSEYDYFTDGDTGGNEWVWRFPKGASKGELNRAYAVEWVESYSTRQDVEEDSHTRKIDTLPEWARD